MNSVVTKTAWPHRPHGHIDRMTAKAASAEPASTIHRHFPRERDEALSAEADSIGKTGISLVKRDEALSAEADSIGINRHFPRETR